MSEISPANAHASSYKPGVNSWEESMDQHSPDDGAQFVEAGPQDLQSAGPRDVDACQTYTVVSDEPGPGHPHSVGCCDPDSPTDHLCGGGRPLSVGYGGGGGYHQLEDYRTRQVVGGGQSNGQGYHVVRDPQDQQRRQQAGERNGAGNDVVLLQAASTLPHDGNTAGMTPPNPQPSPYGSEGLTHLANCCSENAAPMPTPGGGNVITPPVIHIPEELQGKSTICIQLEHIQLWQDFHKVDTEMIITKAGRRMFPGISTTVFGLEPDVKYTFQMEMTSFTKNRFKYMNSQWVAVGKGEPHEASQMIFTHPDSPASGKQWMRDKVAYKKIKLTNDKNSKKGYVVLNSMHKYQPRIHVLRHLNKKETTCVYSIDFPQTQFVAVTAYQNDLVTQLKIDNNPFAKAFREPDDQQCKYPPGVMVGGWGLPPTPTAIPSPAESTFSNSSNTMSSPGLPGFNVAFGNWDINARPPVSPYIKQERPLSSWAAYSVPISPTVSSPMLVPQYPTGPLQLPTTAPGGAGERPGTLYSTAAPVQPSYLCPPFPMPVIGGGSGGNPRNNGSSQKSPEAIVE